MKHDNTTPLNPAEAGDQEQTTETTLEPIADILARAKSETLQEAEDIHNEEQTSQTESDQKADPRETQKTDQKKPPLQQESEKTETASSSKNDETSEAESSPSHWQDASVKEAEKAERRLADSQKWGREAHSKLKSVEHLIGQYLEKGILSDEEAALLLASSQHPDLSAEQKEEPLLVRYGTIWDKELANMRKYTDAPDLDLHIQAFQHFLKNGSSSEVMEAFTELKALEKDDVAFTRKMLEMGKAYYEEVYKDIHTAGSLKDYKLKREQEISRHLRHIDKLEKEIVKYKEQYEDYIPSKSYRLPSGGSAEPSEDSDSSIGSIIDRAKMGTLRR
jgi:hypothetical protein